MDLHRDALGWHRYRDLRGDERDRGLVEDIRSEAGVPGRLDIGDYADETTCHDAAPLEGDHLWQRFRLLIPLPFAEMSVRISLGGGDVLEGA